MNETRTCVKCGITKPSYAFYRKKHKKVGYNCIKCSEEPTKTVVQDAEKQKDLILNKTVKSVYNHYLVTVVDENFNEFTGTISARLHFELKPDFLGLDSFMMDGKRMFYEAKVDKMSADEYYSIHDRDKDQKGLCCPNITIIKTMSKKAVKEALHEFLMAMYFFHKEC